MRTKSIIYSVLLSAISLSACNNDHDYASKDPDGAPNAPTCYDVNDLHQNYGLHYKPSHGWVGDPMPFYKDGKFHVFYLQDARDGAATFHPWYKATTSDFVSYTDDGEMIACGTIEEQDGALGTGSVFEHNGVYYGFYTGHNGKLDPRETMLLATSTDLNTWTKKKDFELRASNGYDRNEFRDPLIIKEGNTFKMLISTRADYKGSWRAVIAQYKSTDLLNWTLETPFYDDDKTFMVECPDVFTEGNFQYLIYSDINDRMVHYKYRAVGASEWTNPAKSALDGIAYYAGKSASDGTNRYLFGWCPTRDKHQDIGAFGWGGSLVVHKLVQNANGTLDVTIPAAIAEKIAIASKIEITGSSKQRSLADSYTLSGSAESQDYITFDRLSGGASRITTTIKPSTATKFGFEFGACGNRREVYALTFDTQNSKLQLNKVLRLDGTTDMITTVPLEVKDQYNVSIVIENSVCSIYVNGTIAFTNRIYKMNQNPWGVFANDGDVTYSDLKIFK